MEDILEEFIELRKLQKRKLRVPMIDDLEEIEDKLRFLPDGGKYNIINVDFASLYPTTQLDNYDIIRNTLIIKKRDDIINEILNEEK